jgi:hypothetical protein
VGAALVCHQVLLKAEGSILPSSSSIIPKHHHHHHHYWNSRSHALTLLMHQCLNNSHTHSPEHPHHADYATMQDARSWTWHHQ